MTSPSGTGSRGEVRSGTGADSHRIYRWDGARWVLIPNVPGPQGPRGPRGAKGDDAAATAAAKPIYFLGTITDPFQPLGDIIWTTNRTSGDAVIAGGVITLPAGRNYNVDVAITNQHVNITNAVTTNAQYVVHVTDSMGSNDAPIMNVFESPFNLLTNQYTSTTQNWFVVGGGTVSVEIQNLVNASIINATIRITSI
mgnify:CR=1 FL=1